MSDVKTGSAARGPGRVAGATAAVVATGALACGVCCVLPFALPAAVLALSGGVLAWFSGLYHWMTLVAIAAVIGSWAWIGWQSWRTRKRPARSTAVTMVLATGVLAAAIAWPQLEGPVTHLLRGR
jgi:hypothetical protein